MGMMGTVVVLTAVYLIGVLAGRFQAGGSRRACKKTILWKARYKEHLAENRIRSMSTAMRGLSNAFRDSGSSSFDRMNREIAATALAETAREICQPCGGCHLGKTQLQKDTYYLRYLMTSFAKNGHIDTDDMPRIFSETCCEMPRYLNELNEELGRTQMQIDWKKRFLESREVVVAQFQELESWLGALADAGENRQDVTEQWERQIRRECRRLHVRLGRCYIEQDRQEHLRLHLWVQGDGRHFLPARELSDALGLLLKRRLRMEENGKTIIGREACRLVMAEEPPFGVCYGVARAVGGGGEISGDNYSAMELSDGRFLLCLSDGMGSGSSASEESEAVVELTEQLMDAGFSLEGTVKAINSVLLLREGEQKPATLDLHCLNLYTGSLTSRKQGAAATFVKRGDQVSLLESGDMPIGWSRNVTGEESVRQMEKETFLILVTDGVIEALPGTEKEEFLMEILRRMKGSNPQVMAEDILALSMGQEEPRDDMTVMVAQIQAR